MPKQTNREKAIEFLTSVYKEILDEDDPYVIFDGDGEQRSRESSLSSQSSAPRKLPNGMSV